jgi:TRAP-type C4-dicarboxylate transport system substrate-binding protein
MHPHRLALGALALSAGALHIAVAQEAVLTFATTNAPQVHLNQRVHHPWAARINEQGKGAVRIDVRDGPAIANHLNFYQRVLDDVVQVSWGLPAYVAGKFPLVDAAALPFIVDKSEDASVAFWRLYKSGALDHEFNEVVALHLIVFPQVGVHLSRPPKSLDSLAGLKLGAGSKISSQIALRLGATPISLPLTDYYEGIQRGTIDGSMSQWTQFQPFKLAEVTTYHVEASLGGAVGMTFMAKKKWAALPAAARKIIEDNSGEKQSRLFGAFWDTVNGEGRKMVEARGAKHQIVALTREQEAAWRKAGEAVVAEWVKTVPGGEKILAAYRTELEKVTAGR